MILWIKYWSWDLLFMRVLPRLLTCRPVIFHPHPCRQAVGSPWPRYLPPLLCVCRSCQPAPALSVGFAQRLGFSGLCKPFTIRFNRVCILWTADGTPAVYGASWSPDLREAPQGLGLPRAQAFNWGCVVLFLLHHQLPGPGGGCRAGFVWAQVCMCTSLMSV